MCKIKYKILNNDNLGGIIIVTINGNSKFSFFAISLKMLFLVKTTKY